MTSPNSRSEDLTVLRRSAAVFFPLAVASLVGCSSAGSVLQHVPTTNSASVRHGTSPRNGAFGKIKHVIVIIQENRSVDNLFNGFCLATSNCANTVTKDPVSGQVLVPVPLSAPYSPLHNHPNFVAEFDGGKMDGFPSNPSVCNKPGNCPYTSMAYVPATETMLYRKLATVDGILSDMTFEAIQGPSFPSHLYAIAGQSGGWTASNHWTASGGDGNCGPNQPKNMPLIDMTTAYPGVNRGYYPPCVDFPTILDALTTKGNSWKFYSGGSNFWTPTQGIQHLYNPNYQPNGNFAQDVAKGQLADVTFVTPYLPSQSDHPGMVNNSMDGPNWVASLVNAVGESPFWSSSAIVVYWDDWGGWFDHVLPPADHYSKPFKGSWPSWLGNPDPVEYGFRVPFMVISPYARVGVIDHTPRSFVSSLTLIEQAFQIPSMNTLDQYEPDGLDSMMNYNQNPLPYTPVGGYPVSPFSRVRSPHK
ncbi:MAG: hypothetical protein JO043_11625 [Candidatus Eremiobacteraeota bacterium]|nr:hypothetical protein [Candidatus Eremiobacteraeota bacterium]